MIPITGRHPVLPRIIDEPAPPPSPKRTQVVRSFQSTMRLKVSAPITKAFFAMPLLM